MFMTLSMNITHLRLHHNPHPHHYQYPHHLPPQPHSHIASSVLARLATRETRWGPAAEANMPFYLI